MCFQLNKLCWRKYWLSYMSISITEEVGTVMIAIVFCQIHWSKPIWISLQWTDVIIQQHSAALREREIRAVMKAFQTLLYNPLSVHGKDLRLELKERDRHLQFSILRCIMQGGPTPEVFQDFCSHE